MKFSAALHRNRSYITTWIRCFFDFLCQLAKNGRAPSAVQLVDLHPHFQYRTGYIRPAGLRYLSCVRACQFYTSFLCRAYCVPISSLWFSHTRRVGKYTQRINFHNVWLLPNRNKINQPYDQVMDVGRLHMLAANHLNIATNIVCERSRFHSCDWINIHNW